MRRLDMDWLFAKAPEEGGDTLVIVLHGIKGTLAKMAHLIDATHEALPKADIWMPGLPIRTPLAVASPDKIVDELAGELSRRWDEGGYRSLVIVGYSMGSILARELYLRGRNAGLGWALKVERIVLLAGTNLGWSVSHYLGLASAIQWTFGSALGHLMSLCGLTPTVFGVRRGARFLTRMRLRWLALSRGEGAQMPLTIQLLGTVDDLVSPDDNIDFATGGKFIYRDIPNSGHVSVIRMGTDDEDGRRRRAAYMEVLKADQHALKSQEVPIWNSREPTEEEKAHREGIEHVVFVVHGIRDNGYWTDRIARTIWRAADAVQPGVAPKIEKVVSSYGYFGMGPFLFPWVRRRKVEWFVEQYIETAARYPNADISYVGHSNGTYLLSKALKQFKDEPTFRFRNVCFAGSVVERDYDWQALLEEDDQGQRRVERVLNVAATKDWVVAIFPSLFEKIRIQDLGSAGHNGFHFEVDDDLKSRVDNFRYAKGGHGAGKQEALWDFIANFIVNGVVSKPPDHATAGTRVGWVELFGWLNPAVWAGLVFLAGILIPLAILEGWDDFVRSIASGGLWMWVVLSFALVLAVFVALPLAFGFLKSLLRKTVVTSLVWMGVAGIVFAVMMKYVLPDGWAVPEPAAWAPAALVGYGLLLTWVLKKF